MHVHQNFTAEKIQAAGLRVLRRNGSFSTEAGYDIVQKDSQVLMVVQACGDTFYTSGDLHSESTRSLVSFTTVVGSVPKNKYDLTDSEVNESGWEIKVSVDFTTIISMKHAGGYVGNTQAQKAYNDFLSRQVKKG